jgi:hypothetical protein
MNVSWTDLLEKGYVVIRDFLSAEERILLLNDYKAQRSKDSSNANYNVASVSDDILEALEPKFREISETVAALTDIQVDMTTHGSYFATEKGVDFAWHQDHESFFMFQDHYNYLNFYIPFVKVDPKNSNLCVVPFDVLAVRAPDQFNRMVAGGAKRFVTSGSTTKVNCDESGAEYEMPVNLEDIAETPELNAGDLLLIRGDVIHRTQNTLCQRVSASFRRQYSKSMVQRGRLVGGSDAKKKMIEGNRLPYEMALACFGRHGVEELSIGEIQSYLRELRTRFADPR